MIYIIYNILTKKVNFYLLSSSSPAKTDIADMLFNKIMNADIIYTPEALIPSIFRIEHPINIERITINIDGNRRIVDFDSRYFLILKPLFNYNLLIFLLTLLGVFILSPVNSSSLILSILLYISKNSIFAFICSVNIFSDSHSPNGIK